MCSSQLSNFQILVVIMPSENESDLAKSLSDLKEELRSGFSSLKRELVKENNLAIKKLKSTASSAPKFKKKENEKQYKVNLQVLDHVQLASSFLAATPLQVEKALEELKEGEKKLAHRNKFILIADSAKEGWEVVNEYQRRDLADNSDDDKRIRQAESRASQKRRRAQSQKKRPNFYQGSSYQLFSSALRGLFSCPSTATISISYSLPESIYWQLAQSMSWLVKHPPRKRKRDLAAFREELILQLVGNWRAEKGKPGRKRQSEPFRLENVGEHLPIKGAGCDHTCQVCIEKRHYTLSHPDTPKNQVPYKMTKTTLKCDHCEVYLCISREKNCFKVWHNQAEYWKDQ